MMSYPSHPTYALPEFTPDEWKDHFPKSYETNEVIKQH